MAGQRRLFLFLGGATVVAVLLSLFWFSGGPKVQGWHYIPLDAMAVLEVKDPLQTFRTLQQKPAFQNLKGLSWVKATQDRLEDLADMLGAVTNAQQLSSSTNLGISLHPNGTDGIDLLFIIDDNTEAGLLKPYRTLMSNIRGNKDYRALDTKYKGYTITEIKHLASGKAFSVLSHENILYGSFSALLVESVVRCIDSRAHNRMAEECTQLLKSVGFAGSGIKLYADAELVRHFTCQQFVPNTTTTRTTAPILGRFSALQLQVTNQFVIAKGITTATDSNILAIFKGQLPAGRDAFNLIPSRFAAFYHFSFSEPSKFVLDIDALRLHRKDKYHSQLQALKADRKIQINHFYDLISTEAALVKIENDLGTNPHLLSLLKLRNAESMGIWLDSLAKTPYVQVIGADSAFEEEIDGTTIKELKMAQFPAIMLGSFFTGFDNCFYAIKNGYLCFGNNLPTLRRWVQEVDAEEVIGKNKKALALFKDLDPATNITVVFTPSRYLNNLKSSAQNMLAKQINQYSNSLLTQQHTGLQYSFSQGDQFKTVLFAQQKVGNQDAANKAKTDAFKDFDLKKSAGFKYTLQPYLKLFRNHQTQTMEILVQDSVGDIRLINGQGEPVFRYAAAQPLVQEPTVITLPDGKTQFFLATKTKLHLLNEDGIAADGWPIIHTGQSILGATAFSYSPTSTYRFMVYSKGGLTIYDNQGTPLDGWRPYPLDKELVAPPIYVKIGNADGFLVTERFGKIHFLNRKGQQYEGFPVDTRMEISSAPFIQISSTLETSNFTLLNAKAAQIKTYDFKAAITKTTIAEKQLPKLSYQMVSDPTQRSFVVIGKSNTAMYWYNSNMQPEAISDTTGLPLPLKGNNTATYQYFDFGAQNRLLSVNLKNQVMLYRTSGQPLIVNALPTTSQIRMLYSEASERYTLYRLNNNILLQGYLQNLGIK